MEHRYGGGLAAALLLLSVTMCGLPAPAGARVSAADRAATKTYVEAVYTWEQAAVANLPASGTAFDEFAGRIQAECPGVVANALPPEPVGGQTLRQLDERIRKTEQLSELEGETTSALFEAWEQPDRQATAALAAAVEPLRWSNPTLTRQVQLSIARFAEGIDSPLPDVCGDIREWVASGYKTLSTATREYRSRKEARNRTSASSTTHFTLAPYEGAYEKALTSRTKQLASEVEKPQLALNDSLPRILGALGFAPEPPETISTNTQSTHQPPKTSSKNSVKLLPGGLRPLVHGRAPQGQGFAIIAQHYRFEGHDHFALSVTTSDGSGGSESPSGRRPRLFSSAVWTSCQPHEYAIVYGLLKAPGDTVFARISGKLQPLRRVAIPASFRAGGVLVYVAAARVPTELIVRTSSGRTLLTESLSWRVRDEAELCEGESEGTGTAPA